jgi:hypothetical protein
MGGVCSGVGQTYEQEIIYEGDPARMIISKRKVKLLLIHRTPTKMEKIANITRRQYHMKLLRKALGEQEHR